MPVPWTVGARRIARPAAFFLAPPPGPRTPVGCGYTAGVEPPGEASDPALLAAWSQGDEVAGRTLLRRHVDAVARFFRSKVGDEPDDLVQTTFLELTRSASTLRDPTRFRAFLFGIARRVLFAHFKARRRHAARFDPMTTTVAAMQTSPSARVARDQAHARLLAALQSAPVDDQIVLELHYWEALSTAEIAAALDTPVGTIKGRLQRARARLETALREEPGPAPSIADTMAALSRAAQG